MEVQQHNCDTCGGILIYDEDKQEFVCEFCNNSYDYDESIDYSFDLNYCKKCDKYYSFEETCKDCNSSLVNKKIGVRSYLENSGNTIVRIQNIINAEYLKMTSKIKGSNNKMVRGKIYDGNIVINYSVNGKTKSKRYIFFNIFIPDLKNLTDNEILFYFGNWVKREDVKSTSLEKNVNKETIYLEEGFEDNSKRILNICLKHLKMTEHRKIENIKVTDNLTISNKVYCKMPVFQLSNEEKNKLYSEFKRKINATTIILFLLATIFSGMILRKFDFTSFSINNIPIVSFIFIFALTICSIIVAIGEKITKDWKLVCLYLSDSKSLFKKYFKKNVFVVGEKHE